MSSNPNSTPGNGLRFAVGLSLLTAAVLVLPVGGGWVGYRLAGWMGAVAMTILGVALTPSWLRLLFESGEEDEGQGFGETDEQGRPHGRWLWDYPDGRRLREAHFRHGELAGTDSRWFANGQKACEGTHPDGEWKFWEENGDLAMQGDVLCGEREGLWTFRVDSTRKVEGHYHRGLPHGAWILRDENGHPLDQTSYAHGVPLGHDGLNPDSLAAQSPGLAAYLVALGVAALVVAALARNVYLLAGLAVLLACLTIHESGHFLVAKAVGIPIRRFRIGFGPPLVRRLWRGTWYELSLFPLLGFVEPYRMYPEEFDSYRDARKGTISDDALEFPSVFVHTEERPSTAELVSRPRQLAFFLGGIGFNLAAGWLALTIAFHQASRRLDADPPLTWLQSAGRAASAATRMAGNAYAVLPRAVVDQFRPSKYTDDEPGMLAALAADLRRESELTTPPEGEEAGTLAQGRARVGPVLFFLGVFAWFNVFLTAFNILPVPPLDGWHLFRIAVETVTGRPPPPVVGVPVFLVGTVVLLALTCSGVILMIKDLLVAVFR